MVKHLTHRFGGSFYWDGQLSFDTQREAEDDRTVQRLRTRQRHMQRNAKRAATEVVLREAFPRQGG